jgi:AmmeMemoRadiSam system protein B
MYSGAIAGSAYGTLYGRAGHVRRVILLGPTHHGARHALNLSSAAAFATPLGEVQCGAEATDRLARLPGVGVDDGAHRPEHCLEVQLPFLQVVLGMFEVVPVLVGTARDEQVSEALAALWGGAETLVVVSSDLSHYHDYRTAQALDSVTAAAITQLEGGRLTGTDACGSHAIRGLLHRARALELHATLLDLRNSGDTAGGRDRVVGYGAFSFAATPSAAAA